MRVMLKSKIHRARITEVNLEYEGSITIDRHLMEEADILPHEQVGVLNVNNGIRFTTYALEAEGGSGTICLNGPAARLGAKGDPVIILTYRHLEDTEANNLKPRLVYVDSRNAIVSLVLTIEV